ncbi:MAG: methylenetetrahydrofolate reductase [NAD(P)H] [Clostridium perfringens]|nr:methylenetetrahydrofolate reductase [NAD(P)H] [Clostridium perfringens]
MRINEIFRQKEIVLSFEIFPPKPNGDINKIYNTLEELKDLKPDYISVTYGAGGSTIENKTIDLASKIKNQYNIESVAHLTCIKSTKKDIDNILSQLRENNIENILALRGDIVGECTCGDFKYASDLVSFIKEYGDFNIGGACYPECHPSCESLDKDIENLKKKVDCGTSNLVSQLFFDNDIFYRFLDKACSANIDIPIQAGIMPVINKKQIERIVSLCGATFPKKFMKIVDKYEYNEVALRDAGIAYAVEQIIDLLSSGVKGIHLYTMNNPKVAKGITNNISSIIKCINEKGV